MTDFTPPKRIDRLALKDPEWWTSIAVNLASFNVPGMVVDLSKLLKKHEINPYKELAQLYNDTFLACLTDFDQVKIALKPTKKEFTIDELKSFDPNFPMSFLYFQELLSESKIAAEKQSANTD
ncbi:MAG: hypothetical protein ACREOP_05375, partial [Thermodesulfobacteriota bacterium]